MTTTPIYDQLVTEQQQAEDRRQQDTAEAAERKAIGLPWLLFWRG